MRLVTHNAYWFQGAPSLWGRERPVPHPRALAALIDCYRSLAPDILCLQEVHASDVLDSLCDALGLTGRHVAGGLRREYGGAVLWRRWHASVHDFSRRPVAPHRVFERICMAWQGAGAMPLRVVNVHLASNRYAPDRRGEPVRLAELEAMLRACPDADVIAGDFNARTDSRVHERMVAAGFTDVCGDVPLQADDARRRVDYVWVRGDARWSVTAARVLAAADLDMSGAPGVALSDHPALSVDLERRDP